MSHNNDNNKKQPAQPQVPIINKNVERPKVDSASLQQSLKEKQKAISGHQTVQK